MEDRKNWQAKWIWRKELAHARGHELVYFRRSFAVPEEGGKLVVHVSADSRYRLYLNGEPVSVGPCKGDAHTHYYETVDLSDKLLPGTPNALAAKVLHYGGTSPWRMAEHGPVSVWRSEAGGFLLEGALTAESGELIERLDTDGSWRCLKDEGYDYVPVPMMQWAGGLESVDGAKQPQGWETAAYDDGGWPAAVPFYDVRNDWGELSPWSLEPRPIPPLYERTSGFRSIAYAEGAAEAALQSLLGPAAATGGSLQLAPNSRMVVELDAGQLTTGYIRLELAGGQGALIRILCAECYEPEISARGKRVKGIRNQREGGKLMGEYDSYRVAGTGAFTKDGLQPEAYEPFWFRTFRYVRLEIETGPKALALTGIGYRETGYPLEVESEFDCSDPDFKTMWTMGIRTLQLCMHETYEDCPYYEQLQYTKDTRLMMRYQYGISTDDRLAKRAMFDFHSSQLPSGMLQCRTPSMFTHIIPAFSFDWIYMLQEHFAYFGDLQLIRRYRPTVIALLDWFERARTAEGLVGGMPPRYWTHFDWVNEWPGGSPPLPKDRPMTLHSLMYAAALNAAAELMQQSGWTELAAEYRDKAADVNAAVIRTCWSEKRQLFEDAPGSGSFSQHPQVWAVLSGLTEGDAARQLLQRSLHDESLPVISLPMTYQLLQALNAAGLYDELGPAYWERWRKFIGLELTTFPEEDIVGPRSDCHGWSALPLSEFTSRILGVAPGAPGFETIAVRPTLGKLAWARGKVATVKGPVSVEWHLQDERFTISVDGPSVPIELALPDGTTAAFIGKGQYSCGISKTSDHLHS
ncbi:alpha-L-rhamnosidase-related protein [Paenibacillus silvisoli]|uniref:alpha-L-rhamnosidase-related protein n=1 Tax=Paenibacillus silvisoli TaxID=3110539 RepID=UPI0028050866|nr:alpha-L-rhamnosidase C-terminal domain-containing protein [Paenibacillus silvisoli]